MFKVYRVYSLRFRWNSRVQGLVTSGLMEVNDGGHFASPEFPRLDTLNPKPYKP